MKCQLLHVSQDAPDKLGRGLWILQGNEVGDGIQVSERRLGPDYFSHRARRFLACAWVATRPSAIACSPRAMPSSTPMRCCISW